MLNIRAQGVAEAIRQAGRMREQLINEIDADVEATMLLAINRSKSLAPVDTSRLRNSIMEVRQERRIMQRAYGSDVEYAQRQEYEHKTKRGYFRKALWEARTTLRDAVGRSIARLRP